MEIGFLSRLWALVRASPVTVTTARHSTRLWSCRRPRCLRAVVWARRAGRRGRWGVPWVLRRPPSALPWCTLDAVNRSPMPPVFVDAPVDTAAVAALAATVMGPALPSPASGGGQRKSRLALNQAASQMVPRRGLEPPRSYPLVPETSASTNSATWAFRSRAS